jgi:hypothetical protein
MITVKGNMPTLYRQLKKLPWAAVPAISDVSTDHGRWPRRTIQAVLAPTWIGFDGAAQVAQLRRTVTTKGKKAVEVVYLITSDRDADPAALAACARSHREIENRLHRDVTYQEDKSLGPDGKPSPRDGDAAQPGHQLAAPGLTRPTSPPPTTPATRIGRYSCFRPHERLCRVPGRRL